MPYYQRLWNVLLGDKAPPVAKNQRMVPNTEHEEKKANDEPTPPKELSLDLAGVYKAHEYLKIRVEELQRTHCADAVKDSPGFGNYKIDQDKVIFQGLHSTIYLASHPDVTNMPLMVRIFKPTVGINPENDEYLKIVRYLANSSPHIIATLDIYADEQKYIYLMQEFGSQGNVENYIRNNKINEDTMCLWAQSLYSAMDHLGSYGIAHRGICPKHLLLTTAGPEGKYLQVKLGSFRDAIVYWDPVYNDIINQPCKPMTELSCSLFTAPECFGSDKEVYDPVAADIWSYGATLFYCVSLTYPMNTKELIGLVDAEIRNTLAACGELSNSAKYWLYAALRSNVRLRVDFDIIPLDIWFKLGSKADQAYAAATATAAVTN